MARGGFITFEGGEGAGKSTQVRALRSRLQAAGVEVLATREPGGSPYAEKIREAILSGSVARFGPAAEAVMFSAARSDHLETLIRPALSRGAFVICDRFIDSTRVYQGRLGQVDATLVAALERIVVGAERPDLTVVLDIAPELGLARAAARRRPGERPDRFEREGVAYHRQLRDAFLDLAAAEPVRCVVIDASLTSDVVARAIWTAAMQRLPALSAGLEPKA